jgi:hypothetical protein
VTKSAAAEADDNEPTAPPSGDPDGGESVATEHNQSNTVAKGDGGLGASEAVDDRPGSDESDREALNPYELEVLGAETTEEYWMDGSYDPWTAAARLGDGGTSIEVEGDGLGGHVEVNFDFVPSEIMAQEPSTSDVGHEGYKPSGLSSVVPVAEGQAEPKAALSVPADGKLLFRTRSQPLVGKTEKDPVIVNLSRHNNLAQPLEPGKTLVEPETALPDPPKIATTTVNDLALPPGEELENGVKVFTLIR